MNFAAIEFPIIDCGILGTMIILEDQDSTLNASYKRVSTTDDLDKNLLEEYHKQYGEQPFDKQILFITKDKQGYFVVFVKNTDQHIWQGHGMELVNALRKSRNSLFTDVGIADIKDIVKDAVTFGDSYWLPQADAKGLGSGKNAGAEESAYLYEGFLFAAPVIVKNARLKTFYIPDSKNRKDIKPPRRNLQ